MYYMLDKQHDIKNYNQSHKNDTSYIMIQPQGKIVTKDITNSIINKQVTTLYTSHNTPLQKMQRKTKKFSFLLIRILQLLLN